MEDQSKNYRRRSRVSREKKQINNNGKGFAGGAVVKNPPANAETETRFRALVREDPTCRGATKPVSHNY